MLLPKWDCSTCTPAMKEIRGCGVQGMTATLMGDERLTTCPRFFILNHRQTFMKIVRLHNMLERGFLPDEGGVEDQSALTMEVLEIFGAGLAEARKEKRKTKE